MEEIERKKTKQLSLWVDDLTYDSLDEYTNLHIGTTKSGIMRQALVEFLHRQDLMKMFKEYLEAN